MIVVNPTAIDETNFIDSSIAEPDPIIGESEWVSIPFDGYDIGAQVDNPINVSKGLSTDNFYVFNKSSKEVLMYNSFFSYLTKVDVSSSSADVQCLGTSNFSSSETMTTLNVFSTSVNVRLYSESLSGFITSPNFKSYLDSAGITANAKGLFGIQASNNSSLYFLNQVGSSYYVVKVNIFSSSNTGVQYNRILTTGRGTPRDINYRDGKFSVLFSTASGSSISFYNETFSTELSNHPITGSNPDQPYDSYTIGVTGGFKFLKESTEKIYNVDSNYNHGASYKVGDQVVKSAIHKKYQCLIETTTDPEEGVDLVPPTWLLLGATNRWAMFDGINTYPSISSSDIVVEVRPLGVANAVNIFTMSNCKEVKIVTTLPDTGDTYTVTHDTSGKYDLVEFDLPPYENPLIEVTFTPEDGLQMSIGELVVGEATRIGVLLAGAISDRIDYSRYDYDEFGNLTYIKRPIVKYNTYPIRVMKPDAPGVELFLDEISGKQAVWIGYIGDGDYLVARGNLERSPMTYDNPSIVEYALKVRGSI